MESKSFIYAILFDNGMVKVGKTGNPEKRIKQHANRVSCMGISIEETFVCKVDGGSAVGFRKERLVIKWCVENSSSRNSKEWFSGVDFCSLCSFISTACKQVPAPVFDQLLLVDGFFMHSPRQIVQYIATEFNVSDSEIARQTGTSQATVSRIQNGEVSNCMSDLYIALCLYRSLLEKQFKKAA